LPRHKILVTRRWPSDVEAELASAYDATFNVDDRPLSAEALRAALANHDAVLPTVTDRMDEKILSGPTRARILANYGVGFNHIDLEAAKASGLVVTNTPGVLTDATADLAMTLLLMTARRAGEGERELRAGKWSGWRPTHMLGTQVTGATLGVIGIGRIGRAMAKRCHLGFGMRIVFFDAFPPKDLEVPAERLASVEEVLEAADFVSLHVPGGGENFHLINAERLQRMKPTAFLINSARGDIVDESALVDALKSGRIAGAGLDVYEAEPKVHPELVKMENVTLLPHLGSATKHARVAMGMKVVENLAAFFAGKEPPDRVA
jgi:lactate dehydrogenase-like 2-hydroxyacid dehydrogenase